MLRSKLTLELLEERRVLSGVAGGLDDDDPGSNTVVVSGGSEIISREAGFAIALDRAFQRASDLSNYSAEELDSAKQWVIRLSGDNDPLLTFAKLSVPRMVSTSLIDNTYFFDVQAGRSSNDVVSLLSSIDDVDYFYPLVEREASSRAIFDDSFFFDQWHLLNYGQTGGTSGDDAQVTRVWNEFTGEGVVIGIVDDGLQHTHPDLIANYLASASYDFNDDDTDPNPGALDDHGTAVAGVAAGAGNNGLGISGAAPGAQLAGLRLIAGPTTDALEAEALAHMLDTIDIFNNSWGPADGFGLLEGPGPLTLAALDQATLEGRGGLGTIYVWAGGNGGLLGDNVNLDGYANSRFTIAVAAIDHNGEHSPYSEPGASLLISAYSNGGIGAPGIVTTDQVGDLGYNADGTGDGDPLPDSNYTSSFGGTSSATPLVSGVIALMLEANPNLTYRDVQHILVETAVQNDPTDAGWATNGAGLKVNHKYGFGAIDALAAVNRAKNWTKVNDEVSVPGNVSTTPQTIPDNNPTGVSTKFTMPAQANFEIEWVEVTLDIDHPSPEDLEIVLTSPDGTTSILLEADTSGSPLVQDRDSISDWTFTSARHWGESVDGDWTVTVRDRVTSVTTGTSTVNSVGLTFWGSSPVTQAPALEIGPGPALVLGSVFNDENANGQNNNEVGLAGFTVYADLNNNNLVDANEPTAVTNSQGNYGIELAAGDYTIKVLPKSGFTLLSSSSETTVTADELVRLEFAAAELGNLPSVDGKVSGIKWNDKNGDGIRQVGEPGIEGVYIYADLNGNKTIDLGEPAAKTNSQGRYTIEDLPAGTYEIREVMPFGWGSTTPDATHMVVITFGTEISNVNFGNKEFRDWGDAFGPFPTTSQNNGASHGIVPSFYLGAGVDGELDGIPHVDALGDNLNGTTSDEDGVIFVSGLTAGQMAEIKVTASTKVGYLQGWIDFNGDGDWNDAGEQIVKDVLLNKGENHLDFMVPANAAQGITYARFRYGVERGIGYTGAALMGEVEDYRVSIPMGPDTGLSAFGDSFTVPEDSASNPLTVLANDTITGGGTLTIVSVGTTSQGGTVTIDGTQLLYTPAANFSGTETFTYTVSDGNGRRSTATVSVAVTGVNDLPTANNDSFVVIAGTPLELDVLANDSTAPDSNETLTIISVVQPENGQAQIVNGKILYTPNAGFVGVETFTYTINDGTPDSNATASVQVTVRPGNTPNIVKVRLEARDEAGGDVINSVRVGETFVLNVYVDDLRNNPDGGVFSAYLDVLYNSGLVSTNANSIDFNSVYDQGRKTDINSAGLNEVGAFSGSFTALGPAERLLFSAEFTATGAGTFQFVADQADEGNPVAVYDNNGLEVSPIDIDFGSLQFQITAAATQFRNQSNPYDVNNDGKINPLDALSIIDDLNSNGARSLLVTQSRAARAAVAASTPTNKFIDVNGDNLVSPLDVMMLIKELNRLGQGAKTTSDVGADSSTVVVQGGDKVVPRRASDATLVAANLSQTDSGVKTAVTRLRSTAASSSSPTESAQTPAFEQNELRQELVSTVSVVRTSALGDLDSVLDDIAGDVSEAWLEI